MYQIHHIQITVNDVKKKRNPFYDQLFHLLGFDVQKKYSGYLEHADMEVVEYLSDTFDFGICSPKQEWINETIDSRKPGSLQHIAFKAESRGSRRRDLSKNQSTRSKDSSWETNGIQRTDRA